MEFTSIISHSQYFLKAAGQYFNTLEQTALSNSLLLLKNKGKLSTVLLFGKFFGLKKNYYIAEGFSRSLLGKRTLFVSNNCTDWVQLPNISESNETADRYARAVRLLCSRRFSGDLSTTYKVEIKPAEIKPNALGKTVADLTDDDIIPPVIVSMTEETRLAHHLDWMCSELNVFPRKALTQMADKSVTKNQVFQGLTQDELTDLKNYQHLCKPKRIRKNILELEKTTIAFDFLDTLADDSPSGCWAVQVNQNLCFSILRSLRWVGYTHVHCPNAQVSGGVYVGSGCRNSALAFQM